MDEDGFRKYLKRAGKKPHVIDGLVGQVRRFQDYLEVQLGIDLDGATSQDLSKYAADLDADEPGSARKVVRSVGLYYQFVGNHAMAAQASKLREQGVASQRKPFTLKDFRGVDLEQIERLREAGITNVAQMLQAGATPGDRQKLAAQSGVPEALITELVMLSDLARIPGMKGIRARLYYDAGVGTLEALSAWEPEPLHQMLAEFVERSGFDGIAPLPKEVQFTVDKARSLPRLVHY